MPMQQTSDVVRRFSRLTAPLRARTDQDASHCVHSASRRAANDPGRTRAAARIEPPSDPRLSRTKTYRNVRPLALLRYAPLSRCATHGAAPVARSSPCRGEMSGLAAGCGPASARNVKAMRAGQRTQGCGTGTPPGLIAISSSRTAPLPGSSANDSHAALHWPS